MFDSISSEMETWHHQRENRPGGRNGWFYSAEEKEPAVSQWQMGCKLGILHFAVLSCKAPSKQHLFEGSQHSSQSWGPWSPPGLKTRITQLVPALPAGLSCGHSKSQGIQFISVPTIPFVPACPIT